MVPRQWVIGLEVDTIAKDWPFQVSCQIPRLDGTRYSQKMGIRTG
jgi:hypothetical protein